MGTYVLRHFDDGLSGAMFLHQSTNGVLWWDYFLMKGNPAFYEILTFENEGDAEAFLMANLKTPAIGGVIACGYVFFIADFY